MSAGEPSWSLKGKPVGVLVGKFGSTVGGNVFVGGGVLVGGNVFVGDGVIVGVLVCVGVSVLVGVGVLVFVGTVVAVGGTVLLGSGVSVTVDVGVDDGTSKIDGKVGETGAKLAGGAIAFVNNNTTYIRTTAVRPRNSIVKPLNRPSDDLRLIVYPH
jgi:hypothetical protein